MNQPITNHQSPPITDHDEIRPASPLELSRFVAESARGQRRPLIPVGGRTALHFGLTAAATDRPATLVSLAKLDRTIDFPARDMTVTVEAGVRIDQLSELLATERLQLPIDVPQRNRATLGGVIACNTSGPRRFGYGTLRDYVIGISAIDAGGRSFKAGGRVVKNVAGYDLCKLLIGSLGTLAIITQVTLKLKPIPQEQEFLWAAFSNLETVDGFLERLPQSEARPVVVDVLSRSAAEQIAGDARLELPADTLVLILGVEGAPRESAWQLQRLKDELAAEWPKSIDRVTGEQAVHLLEALTEFPIGAEEPLTFRASLRPSRMMPFLEAAHRAGISTATHAGNGIVVGHLPDDVTTAQHARELLAPLSEMVREAGGGFVILNCDESWKPELPIFGQPPASWNLMRRIKSQLDPEGLLNPGRLFAT